MKNRLESNWKQKIDPAFDKVIRTYANFMTELQRHSNEGKLNFPADFTESIIKKFGWQDNAEAANKDLLNYVKKTGGLKGKDINIFFSFLNSIENENIADLLKICSKIIKSLPEEESRKFYLNALKPYKNDPDLISNLDLNDKNSLDFLSIIISLLSRYFFVRLFEDQKENLDESIDYFKRSNASIAFINFILSSFSQIANLKTLTDLKENISKGDEKAIFRAVTIDKSYLYLDEVKNRIIVAQLTGDNKFFTKLSKAIADNPLKRIGQHGTTYSVLKLFWFHGLYKLTNEELYDFLKSCGLIPPAYPYAFEKFVQRHIKSVYKF